MKTCEQSEGKLWYKLFADGLPHVYFEPRSDYYLPRSNNLS